MATRLVLTTMVKNESRIIRRLLDSVKGKVQGVVVCDTGSTDNTVELARAWMRENEMDGQVYEFPFVNFGKSRTKSFEMTQQWLKEDAPCLAGWDAKTTWAFLLDGDMMLGEKDILDTATLSRLPDNVAGVSLKQANGSLVYSNMRILRCSEPWICKGATHEAWTCPNGKSTILFQEPVLVDRNDGGCKADKYPRDVRLLLEDLAEMPNDARTHFYLGQTYLCMRDYTNAIPVLKKRIELGGWDEEVYIAYMYLGEALMGTGQKGDAIKTWLDGWQYRQHRTEIPMKIITYYRSEPKSQFIAGMFVEKLFALMFGEELRTGTPFAKQPNNDILFVNRRNEDFHIWEELLILAFYAGLGKPTMVRMDELEVKNQLSWHDFNGLFGQLHWYAWTLPCKTVKLKPKISSLPWIDEDDAHVWQPFNPSIRVNAKGDGYDLNLRFANYFTNDAKAYGFRGFNGQVLTRNLLTSVDVSGEATWEKPRIVEEVLIDPSFKQDMGSHIKGVEDCRLVVGSSKREFLGTSKSYADNGINKIFHAWQDEEGKPYSIRQLPLPEGVSPAECQKNWLPFRQDGKLCYIYSFTPLRICDEDGKDLVRIDTSNLAGFNLKEWRGSAGPVAWSSTEFPEEAYLCVMHKVQISGDGRWYYHRFMTLDKDFKPSRVSSLIRMTKERVEYVSGLCKALDFDGFLMTYGVKDSEAYLAQLETKEVEKLFCYNLKTGATKSFQERLGLMK